MILRKLAQPPRYPRRHTMGARSPDVHRRMPTTMVLDRVHCDAALRPTWSRPTSRGLTHSRSWSSCASQRVDSERPYVMDCSGALWQCSTVRVCNQICYHICNPSAPMCQVLQSRRHQEPSALPSVLDAELDDSHCTHFVCSAANTDATSISSEDIPMPKRARSLLVSCANSSPSRFLNKTSALA